MLFSNLIIKNMIPNGVGNQILALFEEPDFDPSDITYTNLTHMRALLLIDRAPEYVQSSFSISDPYFDEPLEFTFWHVPNIVDLILGVYCDPALRQHMVFEPTPLYKVNEENQRKRVYKGYETGQQWERRQKQVGCDRQRIPTHLNVPSHMTACVQHTWSYQVI